MNSITKTFCILLFLFNVTPVYTLTGVDPREIYTCMKNDGWADSCEKVFHYSRVKFDSQELRKVILHMTDLRNHGEYPYDKIVYFLKHLDKSPETQYSLLTIVGEVRAQRVQEQVSCKELVDAVFKEYISADLPFNPNQKPFILMGILYEPYIFKVLQIPHFQRWLEILLTSSDTCNVMTHFNPKLLHEYSKYTDVTKMKCNGKTWLQIVVEKLPNIYYPAAPMVVELILLGADIYYLDVPDDVASLLRDLVQLRDDRSIRMRQIQRQSRRGQANMDDIFKGSQNYLRAAMLERCNRFLAVRDK